METRIGGESCDALSLQLVNRTAELVAVQGRLALVEAQLDARRSIDRYVSFRLAGDESVNPEDAADSVMARLEEAKRDAERYRWLRERINFRDQFVRVEHGDGISTKWRAWVHDDYRENPPVLEHIDEYIDSARADSADLTP